MTEEFNALFAEFDQLSREADEMRDRLAQAKRLVEALRAIYDGINDEYYPAFSEPIMTGEDMALLAKAKEALAAWQGEEEGSYPEEEVEHCPACAQGDTEVGFHHTCNKFVPF